MSDLPEENALSRASRAVLRRVQGRSRRAAPDQTQPERRRLGSSDIDSPAAIYAIGDVHGCLRELRELEARIVDDAVAIEGSKLLVMLGDYVDRGLSSAGVIDHLLAPPPEGFARVCLCGNHEQAMLAFLTRPVENLGWLSLGGEQTLRSYGVLFSELRERAPREPEMIEILNGAVPSGHRAFLDNLPVLLDLGAFVFVHAGVAPGVPLAQQTTRDLLWIREPFLSRGPELTGEDGHPITVVHGHTPASLPSFGPGRIGIDTAAFATGRLTALRILDGQTRIL